MINLKNIDNWLLDNGDYSQEDRELVLRFMNDYFISNNEIVDSTDVKDMIRSNDCWSEIIITRTNPGDTFFFMEHKDFE